MPEFTLTISLGNAAMLTPEDVAKALRAVAAGLERNQVAGSIRDTNGNRVGRFGGDFDGSADDE